MADLAFGIALYQPGPAVGSPLDLASATPYKMLMVKAASDHLSLAGQLLLALPGIGDPRFEQAVIALCIHNEEGALGIGIGRTLPQIDLHQLLEQLDIEGDAVPATPVHYGGPVDPQRGFVLHSDDWTGEDTVPVAPGLALTTTLDVLRAIAGGTGPDRWLVALGYAGWGAGQLDDELSRHGWFHVAADVDLALAGSGRDRWSRAFASAGIDARLLAATSGTA